MDAALTKGERRGGMGAVVREKGSAEDRQHGVPAMGTGLGQGK
jgi:hypothetical protein